MYYPMLIALILSMSVCVDAMNDEVFIKLPNTSPQRKLSHRRLIEKKESVDSLPKVETGDLAERNNASASPRDLLRRESASRIKEQKSKS